MTPELGVVADDLSGAGDTGLQFAKRGLRTVVLFEWPDSLPPADVVVLETDSRLLPGLAAAERVRSAVRALLRLGVGRVYKKVDSTLRGNLGAEVDALLDELPEAGALVAPAFPANGRTVVGGRLLVRGVPLDETEFAQDPVWPARDSAVAAALARQSRRCTGVIGLDAVRSGWRAIVAEAESLRANGVDVCAVDAETARDLASIAQVVARSERRWVGVGSAGLAEELPGALGLGRAGPAPEGPSAWLVDASLTWRGRTVGHDGMGLAFGSQPALVVVGSVNPVARGQLQALLATGAAVVGLRVEALLAEPSEAARATERAVDEAAAALRAGSDAALVLQMPSGAEPTGEASPRLTGAEASARLASGLGRAASLLLRTGIDVAGLVMTGGDTAKAVCRALGAQGIVVEREVLPGIPQGCLLGGFAAGLPVVTKAGGFGGPDALVEALSFLRRI